MEGCGDERGRELLQSGREWLTLNTDSARLYVYVCMLGAGRGGRT